KGHGSLGCVRGMRGALRLREVKSQQGAKGRYDTRSSCSKRKRRTLSGGSLISRLPVAAAPVVPAMAPMALPIAAPLPPPAAAPIAAPAPAPPPISKTSRLVLLPSSCETFDETIE